MAAVVDREEDRSVVRATSAEDAVRKLTEGDGPHWRLKYAFERTKLPAGTPAPGPAGAAGDPLPAVSRPWWKAWQVPAFDLPARPFDAAMRRSAFLALGLAAAALAFFALAHDAVDRRDPGGTAARVFYCAAVLTGAAGVWWGTRGALGRAWGVPLLVLGAALLTPWAAEADVSYATSAHCDGTAASNTNWMAPLFYGVAAALGAAAVFAWARLRGQATPSAAALNASAVGIVGGGTSAALAMAAAWQLLDIGRVLRTSQAAWAAWDDRDPLTCASTHWIPGPEAGLVLAAIAGIVIAVRAR